METATLTYRFGAVEYDLRRRTHLMGILNVTPDSFSDGGRYFSADDAVRHALGMVEEGADFIDIGGESSRPGSEPVPVAEELRRILPVIERVATSTSIPISVDTTKSTVAERALDAGAVIVNDISGLRFDPAMASVIAKHHASAVVMHIRGTPKSMQDAPAYDDLIGEVRDYLAEGIRMAREAGVEQIIVDPGIGFGKTVGHNLEILRRLGEFAELGYPILVGPSNKSFIGKILGLPAADRTDGTAAAVTAAVMNGAHIVRVHDVGAMKKVAAIADAIARA